MNDGEADNAAFMKLYGKRRPERKQKPTDDLKVGDTVRLSRIKGVFDKEETGTYTKEYFTIHDISKSQNIPMYGLKDYRGKVIEGRAYANELQKIYVEPETVHNISKIHRQERRQGKMMALVSWEGFPGREWIPAADIVDV